MSHHTHSKTQKLTQLAMLSALIVVLQILSALLSSTTLLEFNLTLTLIPLVIGALLYGVSGGCVLGFVFGVIVTINCIFGLDPSGNMLWNNSPLLTIALCVGKGIVAGLVPGLISRIMLRKKMKTAVILSSMAAPIFNTGIFIIGMMTVFRDILIEWAGGSNLLYFSIMTIAGINFLIEFAINILMTPVTLRILKIREKRDRHL